MSAHCSHEHNHDHEHLSASDTPRYRRVLWVALVLNAAMFAVEIGAGFRSGSVSLLADAIDFFGDAANYGVTLAVLSMAWLARARGRRQGAQHAGLRLLRGGRDAWSTLQRRAARGADDGTDRRAGAGRQRPGRGAALRLSRRRCQHAQRVAVLAQRRDRQRGRDARGARRVRHRHRLARPRGGRGDGGARDQRRLVGAAAGARRARGDCAVPRSDNRRCPIEPMHFHL